MANSQPRKTKCFMLERQCFLVLAVSSLITVVILSSKHGHGLLYKWNQRNASDVGVLREQSVKEDPTMVLERVYKERREKVEAVCGQMSEAERNKTNRGFQWYDPGSHALYCAVPKVGSSTWKRLFLAISDNQTKDPFAVSGLNIHRLKHLFDYHWHKVPPTDRPRVAQEAFSFMFSRDPYHRVFSAYCDKIFMLTKQGVRITRQIRKLEKEKFKTKKEAGSNEAGKGKDKEDQRGGRKRRDATREHRESKGTPGMRDFVYTGLELNATFAEILENIAEVGDTHFLPASHTCNPCAISYNVLGEMQTFDQDTEYILDKLNRSHLMKRPVHTPEYKMSSNQGIIKEVVQRTFQLLKHFMSKKKVKFQDPPSLVKFKFLVRMWKTFQMRGLISDAIQFPLNASAVVGVTQENMTSLAVRALENSDDVSVREAQRDKYYRQAFRSVPLQTLKRFSQFAKTDCNLFGYECEPPEIFLGRVDGDEEENIFSSDRCIYAGTEIVS